MAQNELSTRSYSCCQKVEKLSVFWKLSHFVYKVRTVTLATRLHWLHSWFNDFLLLRLRHEASDISCVARLKEEWDWKTLHSRFHHAVHCGLELASWHVGQHVSDVHDEGVRAAGHSHPLSIILQDLQASISKGCQQGHKPCNTNRCI